MDKQKLPERNFCAELTREMQEKPRESLIPVVITFPKNPAAEFLATNPPPGSSRKAIQYIQKECDEQQKPLIDLLKKIGIKNYHSLWINNTVIVELACEKLWQFEDKGSGPTLSVPNNPSWDLQGMGVASELNDRPECLDVPPPDNKTVAQSIQRIGTRKVWDRGFKGQNVVVAVIDSGVNYYHPDLACNMWDGGPVSPYHGYDFVDNQPDPMDRYASGGHGTLSAGIIAGDGTSNLCTGIAPEAKIMALRVVSQRGQTVPEHNFWRAMQFAIEQGADLISMSLTHKPTIAPNNRLWRRACETILAAEMPHANSIGNQGRNLDEHPIPTNIFTPGNCPPPRLHECQKIKGGRSSVISCGNVLHSDMLFAGSARGPSAWETGEYTDYLLSEGGLIKPDICAPGASTVSTQAQFSAEQNKFYCVYAGTSAATAHIGGCLALLVSAIKRSGNPVQPSQIQEALENTAVKRLEPSPGTMGVQVMQSDKENHYGAGLVNIYEAFKYGVCRGWWKNEYRDSGRRVSPNQRCITSQFSKEK